MTAALREDVVPIAKLQHVITVMPIVLLRIISTQKAGYPRVVRQLMLVERRIHLIENLCLDEPVKNKVYELRVALLFQASLVR